jgi:Na+/H+ antiporter NhaD/arsenite permease-like protein
MTEAQSFAPSGTRRDFLIFAGIVTATAVVLWFATSDIRQTAAGSVFLATVVGTLMFWRFRLAVAFFGIAALLATQSLDIAHMIQFMNLDVITFLVAMMIIVDIAKDSGFSSWLLGRLLKVANYDPKKVLVILLVVSTLMAALVDEVTSILFMIAIVFEYCS